MGDNDKPFVCTHTGCCMRFTNEDHLSVHRMKHEMSLTLTPGTRSGLFPLADQTPTPTKFLKNCEEIGLFNELTKNPFEEAFKKASETLTEGKVLEVVNMTFPGIEADALNTPTPTGHMPPNCPVVCVMTPNKEPEYVPLPGPDTEMGSTIASTPGGSSTCGTPQSSTPRRAPSTPAGTPTSGMALPFKLRHKLERDSELLQSPSTPRKDIVPEERPSPRTERAPSLPPGRVPSTDSSGTSTATTIPATRIALVTPTPVVNHHGKTTTAASIVSPAHESVTMVTAGMTATTATGPYTGTNSGKHPQCYLQVMIQMPSGEMVPVQIPAAISQSGSTSATDTSTISTSQTQASGSLSPVTATTVTPAARTTQRVTSSGSTASMSTKQKLKAALQQSVLSSNMRVMTEAVDRVSTDPELQSPVSLQSVMSPVSIQTAPSRTPKPMMGSQISPASSVTTPLSDDDDFADLGADESDNPFSPKRFRHSTEGPDPDDRRKKFLERNRAAAARCRQKKKMWVTNLEKKAADLQATNSKLQQEVTSLRSEVAQLKTLLLAHKDCPVTQQQQLKGVTIKSEGGDLTSPPISLATSRVPSPHPPGHSPGSTISTDDSQPAASQVSPASAAASVLRTIHSVAPFVIKFD